MRKKILTFLICLVLVSSLLPLPARAATQLPQEIFLEQEVNSSCTLCTSAMMLRAHLYLSGNSNWSKITESAIRPYAWVSQGLLWNWSYTIEGSTINVSHENLSGISVTGLKALVDKHPEGIVLHIKSIPHSVLITDYEGDTFYCADPASWYSGKRIPIEESYFGSKLGKQANILSQASAYWYISSSTVQGSRFYIISYDANGGTGAPAQTYAYAGQGGTLHAQSPTCSGFTFLGWSTDPYATAPSYYPNGQISTSSDLTLYAVWQKDLASADTRPFLDIIQSDYFYTPIIWAVNQGITSGTSSVTFSPAAACTRAQAVTFLYRAAGMPSESAAETPFTDVDPGAYYADAVAWAVAEDLTEGTSATTFSPDAPCTRAQIVTFLQRFLGGTAAANDDPFTDVPAGEYYRDAVLWAVEMGITNGTTPTTFSPNETCTRGQIVTFLYRAMN